MSREAMKLALEALKNFEKAGLATLKTIDAITAIKQALEQPEPELVAWVHLESWKTGKFWPDDCFSGLPVDEWTPLYTSPPKREPLTDEQMEQIHQQYGGNIKKIMRAVEAAHGIKGEA